MSRRFRLAADWAGQPENPGHKHTLEQAPMSSQKLKPILTAGPSITKLEMDYVADACAHGWNQDWNLYLERFQRAFGEVTDTRFNMATSSCTGALHLALLSLGVGPGDEVLGGHRQRCEILRCHSGLC